MFRYAVWGVLLRSDLPLPSLRPARDGDSERLALTLLHSEAPLGDPERWLYTERLGDTTQPWRAVGASRTSFFVRLFGAVDFVLERESPTARFFVAKTAPLGVVEPLFLEQALPLWLSLLSQSATSGSSPPAGPQFHRGRFPLARTRMRYEKRMWASLDGFTLHAATRAGALDTRGREALLKYVLRPAIAQDRVTQRADRLIRIALKRPFSDG